MGEIINDSRFYFYDTDVECLLAQNCVAMQKCHQMSLSSLSSLVFLSQHGNSLDLVAHGALEAPSMPLVPPSQLLLCCIDGFSTLWALGHLDRLERHLLRFRCRFA